MYHVNFDPCLLPVSPGRPRGPPGPRGGCQPPPRRVSRDCSGAVCARELKFCMTDPSLNFDVINCSLFSGQVRSPTYDVMSKPPHGHKMPQLHNAVNGRQSFAGRWSFQNVTNPGYLHFVYLQIFHAGHLRSGQSRDLTHYKPMGNYWNCSFCNINDIFRTQTHQMIFKCTADMSPSLILAFCLFCVTS